MLENLEPIQPVRNCKMRSIIDSLETEDADILKVALADRNKWRDYPLTKALEARGIQVSPNVLSKHRNNSCSCRFANA